MLDDQDAEGVEGLGSERGYPLPTPVGDRFGEGAPPSSLPPIKNKNPIHITPQLLSNSHLQANHLKIKIHVTRGDRNLYENYRLLVTCHLLFRTVTPLTFQGCVSGRVIIFPGGVEARSFKNLKKVT